MSGIDIDDVKPALDCADRSLSLPATEFANVRLVHLAPLNRVPIVMDHVVRRAYWILLGLAVGYADAVVCQFDGGQRTMFLHGTNPFAQLDHMIIVPQPAFTVRRTAGTGVNRTLLGRDNSPTAFRFHAAMRDISMMLGVAHGIAMRNLKKTVFCYLWANLERREEHVIAGVAGHLFLPVAAPHGQHR